MHIAFTPEQEELRREVRAYFGELMTPALQAELLGSEGGGPLFFEALRTMAKDGWLGIGWPEEYGGQGRPLLEQFIFADETLRSGFPFPLLTIGTVGPTLITFGSDEQKAEYLPRVLKGECLFCIGYSEPGAGTDLASLETRAVRDGDDWLITGQKIFTSQAEFCDYVWLAARTDPEAEKHAGISIFIVPTDAEGYRLSPIETSGGVRTNATYYDEVRVPGANLVGGEGMGWTLIVNQLKYERIALMSPGLPERLYLETLDWAREQELSDGSKPIDRPWVRENLAKVRAKLDVLKLLNWRQLAMGLEDVVDYAQASTVKVYGSEFFIESYRLLLEVLGSGGCVREGEVGAVLRGKVERMQRAMLILTFGGGTNEIQREIIAMAGLAMPRTKR